MQNLNLHNITNNFQDVRLNSLSSWRDANKFEPRDHAGPYVVTQEGYDPEDPRMIADEFILGRSGEWLSLAHFYRLPIPERRKEFVFGTAAEVMRIMYDLPSKPVILRGKPNEGEMAAPENDEMAAALRAGKDQSLG